MSPQRSNVRGGRVALSVAALASAAAVGAVILPLSIGTPAGASATARTFTLSTDKVAKVGTVLTTSSGLTLYRFTSDPVGKATCTGTCAKVWPPLLLPKGDHLKGPHGVTGLGSIRVGHGHSQVTFHGAALYRFASDTKKGQAKGQGVEGTWFAALKSGRAPTVAATTTTAAPATVTTVAPKGSTTTATTKPVSSPAPTPAPRPTTPTTQAPPPTTTPPTQPPPPPAPTPTTTTTTAPPAGGYGY